MVLVLLGLDDADVLLELCFFFGVTDLMVRSCLGLFFLWVVLVAVLGEVVLWPTREASLGGVDILRMGVFAGDVGVLRVGVLAGDVFLPTGFWLRIPREEAVLFFSASSLISVSTLSSSFSSALSSSLSSAWKSVSLLDSLATASTRLSASLSAVVP